MSHNVAEMFEIDRRGFIREGYYADLVLVDLQSGYTVSKENILYKCKWSPFEGFRFNSTVKQTIINGRIAYDNGNIIEGEMGRRLLFNR
jgi:dihydroorotase